MANYKITNITNTFGKRDVNYMKALSIDYIDGLRKKTLELRPNKTITISTNKLPLSVHRLRMRNLIVVEIGDDEIPKKPVKEVKKKEETSTKTKSDNKSTTSTKKSSTSNKTTSKSTKKDDDIDKKST